MVRSFPDKSFARSVWEGQSPRSICEYLVNFLKEGRLHIGPGVFLPLEWNFNKTQVTDGTIEKEHVCMICPWSISVL